MKTKKLGEIGELKAITKLSELGFEIFLPFSENSPIDFIAKLNNKIFSFQVKSTEKKVKGKYFFDLQKTRVNSKGSKRTNYKDGDFDFYILYAHEGNYLGIQSYCKTMKHITLRIDPPKSNQKKFIRWAKDSSIENILLFID